MAYINRVDNRLVDDAFGYDQLNMDPFDKENVAPGTSRKRKSTAAIVEERMRTRQDYEKALGDAVDAVKVGVHCFHVVASM